MFQTPGSREHDLLQFMTDTKPQIDQLVAENVNKTGRKLQLVLKAELLKPIKEEAIEVFLQSAMTPVYGTSLPQPFLKATDKTFYSRSLHREVVGYWIQLSSSR